MGYTARGRTRARAITLRVRPTLPSDRRFASSAIFTGRKGVRSEKSADERYPAGDERLGLPGVVGARLPTPRGERQAPLLRGSIPDRGGEFDVLSPPSSLRYGLVGQADPRGVPVRAEVPADDHPRPAPCAHGRGARPLPRGPETDPRGREVRRGAPPAPAVPPVRTDDRTPLLRNAPPGPAGRGRVPRALLARTGIDRPLAGVRSRLRHRGRSAPTGLARGDRSVRVHPLARAREPALVRLHVLHDRARLVDSTGPRPHRERRHPLRVLQQPFPRGRGGELPHAYRGAGPLPAGPPRTARRVGPHRITKERSSAPPERRATATRGWARGRPRSGWQGNRS